MYNTVVTDYLDAAAAQYGQKTAFADDKRSVSFAQVRSEALSMAAAILQGALNSTLPLRVPVAVYFDRGVATPIAFMAAVYAGCFYTPIDTSMPLPRIRKIVDTLQPRIILTDTAHKEAAESFASGAQVLVYEELLSNAAPISECEKMAHAVRAHMLDTDILYVFFTSGSTGVPKGVIINHRACIDYAEWVTQKFGFDSDTVFGEQAPFYFDNSILDLYQTLKCAATMHIIPTKLFMLPKALFDFLSERKVNTIFWVPSALCIMANLKAVGAFPLPTLRKVLFCGEVMPCKQLNIWRRAFPDCLYANLYGPTEITDVCAYYIVDQDFADDDSLPIGRPCENTDIIVLNDEDKLVTGSEKGELCVRGICLSPGYYNNKEKTAAAFVQNPLNPYYPEVIYRTGDIVHYNERGLLMYDCRKDFQIKHSGHRIELGEIETAISAVEGVDQNCCLYDTQKKRIVMFYTGSIDEKSIIDRLRGTLPDYMIPGKKVHLDTMPMNLNGKIDRVALGKNIANHG